MRERSSHTTVSDTVHSAIYNTLTETCDRVESLGGPFRNTFKEYNTNNGTPVCRFSQLHSNESSTVSEISGFFSYFHRSEGFFPSVTASASLTASSEFASSTDYALWLRLTVACVADEFSAEFSALFLLSPPAEAEAVSVMYVCMHIMFRVHQPTIE